MNRDDIIRMAKEAEAWELIDHDGIAALERFAALVAAKEREALVNLAKGMDFGDGLVSISDLVDALKQRGEK